MIEFEADVRVLVVRAVLREEHAIALGGLPDQRELARRQDPNILRRGEEGPTTDEVLAVGGVLLLDHPGNNGAGRGVGRGVEENVELLKPQIWHRIIGHTIGFHAPISTR